jgi:DNA-binding CsgD family transcriptional regulator
MTASSALISVRATEQLVDALNLAVELEGGSPARLEFLLRQLQALLNRPSRCAVWIMEELTRVPAPRITSRVVVRSPFENEPIGSLDMAQRALDDSAPLSTLMVRRVLDRIRTPVTMIASSVEDSGWFQSVLVQRYLQPLGYVDCISSMWAATRDRAIFLLCHRREADRPFDEHDATLLSLMLRAAAPIVDRELFQASGADQFESLTAREREVLLMLLAGDSEKEIAAKLHRSVHTVHTFVRQLYRRFEVSSRGELMAMFIDKAVVECLRQQGAA